MVTRLFFQSIMRTILLSPDFSFSPQILAEQSALPNKLMPGRCAEENFFFFPPTITTLTTSNTTIISSTSTTDTKHGGREGNHDVLGGRGGYGGKGSLPLPLPLSQRFFFYHHDHLFQFEYPDSLLYFHHNQTWR